MLQTLSPATRLCVAADLTLPTQFIRTLTVAEWRRIQSGPSTPSLADSPVISSEAEKSPLGKRPCVFIILA